jgi:cytochrome c553
LGVFRLRGEGGFFNAEQVMQGERMRKLLAVAMMAMAAIGVVTLVRAAEPKEIKEIMKEAHGGDASLRAKVIGGKADAEEKEKLLALYKDLAENKPPKGDQKSWETKTKAIVTAAEAVVKGDKDATKKLGQATSCMPCHNAHRPKK